MRRERLRPAYSLTELAELYAVPHDHTRWRDHKVRVETTIAIALGFEDVSSVADLSAGDGAVATALGKDRTVLGDFAPGYPIVGPLEQTLQMLEPVDLYICSETLEHLDAPEIVLELLRERTTNLVVSTPVDAWNDHGNPEHYWAWDREAVEAMFAGAGFQVLAFCGLDLRPGWSPYHFGIWALR